MVDMTTSPQIEFGRIVVWTWENDWRRGRRNDEVDRSLLQRLLDERSTKSIHDWLDKQVEALMRTSVPLAPHRVRIRHAGTAPAVNFEDELLLPIGKVCPNWREAMAAVGIAPGQTSPTPLGKIYAPEAHDRVVDHYEARWTPIAGPRNIDDVLAKFSPRYREPSPFDALHGLWNDAGSAS
jgi:hypothetical protein